MRLAWAIFWTVVGGWPLCGFIEEWWTGMVVNFPIMAIAVLGIVRMIGEFWIDWLNNYRPGDAE